MVWKQDLAKLKQQLGEEEPKAPPPKATPKPTVKPSTFKSLDEEDAVFLAAMGQRPSPPPRPSAPEVKEALQVPDTPPPSSPETFEAALGDLKGLKPLGGTPVLGAPTKARARGTAAPPLPESTVPPPPPPAESVSEPIPEPGPTSEVLGFPVRFQLAAGMAIEVDGVLDLRGHCRSDAIERLKDRLEDGTVLGWRSLQVLLGPAPELHEALLELLNSRQVPMISRYAQAPVPMGGNQAWLLYFGPPAP